VGGKSGWNLLRVGAECGRNDSEKKEPVVTTALF
jgi:hypothetical protein